MKITILKILLFLFIFAGFSTKAQQFTEYEVKAAYIFNFTKFITWPNDTFDNSNAPYVLGIYGNDPFGSIIKKIIGTRESNGRKWIVKYYNRPEQIRQCHILFITDIQNSELNRLIKYLDEKPILSIGDEVQNFCQHGGMINFTPKNAAKRFEINHKVAQNANLSISAKLLMLSKIISTDEIKF